MTLSITLPAPLMQRAQQWTNQLGESTSNLIEDAVEAYLEALEETVRLEQALARLKAGEASISWEAFQAIQASEEKDDILSILAAQEAVAQGEDTLVSFDEVKREFGLST